MGPGGATCARLLAHAGVRVIGFERREFPRRKPCGGCITDRALSLLGKGIDASIERSYTKALLVDRGGEVLSLSWGEPIAYGVSREVFDHLLLGMAARAGVEVRSPERVLSFSADSERVCLVTDKGRYRGRYLVGADGAGGIVSRALRGKGRYMVAYEVRLPHSLFPSAPDCVRISFGRVPDGYGWAFPKESHVNAGIITRSVGTVAPRTMLERFLEGELGVRDKGSLEVHGGLIPRYSARGRISSERVLLVGDSGGLTDPFLAEGISYAVLSGSLAAPVLAGALARGGGELGLYEEAVQAILSLHFRSAAMLGRWTRYIPSLSFLIMKNRPRVHEAIFELIRGNANYGEFTRLLKRAALGLG